MNFLNRFPKNCKISWGCVQWEPCWSKRTDRHEVIDSRFSQIWNAAKKELYQRKFTWHMEGFEGLLCTYNWNIFCLNEQIHVCYLIRCASKIVKATIILVMAFSLSVLPCSWDKLAPIEMIFMKFEFWIFFESMLRIFQVSLKSYKNNTYFTYSYGNIQHTYCYNEKYFGQNL